MENFVVSARKYRPTSFDSVVGQHSITTTLKNAIRNNQLAQAYLFCGPRGVGKTTCARIFAKTINCFNINDKVEPCNECESCLSFNNSRSFNIHELDAASNNSVDDIRMLIDQVRIPPQVGKYSIYIIDEVHMLSASAFNAFLKTLEEPPKHAVFILATTEKHKIIPTILSRCQIFDFYRIKIEHIVNYLEEISKNENYEYETDGLNIIAQKADGSMRDALSIYDQINSFSRGKITYKNTIENLNVLDYEYYFKLTDSFLQGNISEVFLIFDEILAKGFDAHNFILGLSKHFRDLLICKDQSTLQLLEVGNNIKDKYKQQSVQTSSEFLFECLTICGQCDINFRFARYQRLYVELSLLKLCQILDKKKSSDELNKLKSAGQKQPEKQVSKTEAGPAQKKAPQEDEINKVKEPNSYGKYFATTPSIKKQVKNNSPDKKDLNENKNKNENEKYNADADSVQLAFTNEKLQKVYSDFINSIKSDKPRLYSTLNTIQPKMVGDYIIELILSNQALLDDFNKNIHQDMIQFLRNELNNESIVFDIKITENIENNTPYTAEEKFKHMLKKNPSLNKLKQQMNLDFE